MRALVAAAIVAAAPVTAALAADPVTVTAQGTSFTPKEVAIGIGDTVAWRNESGVHNVRFVDGSYRSGEPAGDAGKFGERTFPDAGAFAYYCEVHGDAEGGGMAGTITVGEVVATPTPVATATPDPQLVPNATLSRIGVQREVRNKRVHGRVRVTPYDLPGADLKIVITHVGETVAKRIYRSVDGDVRFAVKLPGAALRELERRDRFLVVVSFETEGSAARRTITLKP